MAIDTTVKRVDPPGRFEILAGGGIMAVFLFSVGVFLMVVPIVGWLAGPTLMLAAGVVFVAHLFETFSKKPDYAGHCPYCGAEANAGQPESTHQCAKCNQTFIHHESHLEKV